MFVTFFNLFGSLVLLPLYVQILMGYTAFQAGLVLAPGGLVTLLTLQKARNGAVIAVSQLIGKLTISHLAVFIASALAAGGIAALIALKITNLL